MRINTNKWLWKTVKISETKNIQDLSSESGSEVQTKITHVGDGTGMRRLTKLAPTWKQFSCSQIFALKVVKSPKRSSAGCRHADHCRKQHSAKRENRSTSQDRSESQRCLSFSVTKKRPLFLCVMQYDAAYLEFCELLPTLSPLEKGEKTSWWGSTISDLTIPLSVKHTEAESCNSCVECENKKGAGM